MAKKNVVVDTYGYKDYVKMMKKNNDPSTVPFYVILSPEELKSLNNTELFFLRYYYKQETDYIFSSNVAHIRGTNPISDWGHFVFLDHKSFKVVDKKKILSSKKVKDGKGRVMESYLLQDSKKGNKHYSIADVLSYIPLTRFIEIEKKVDPAHSKKR